MSLLFSNDVPGAYPGSWYADTCPPLAPFAPALGKIRADVAIVGGGYTGLSAALHLAQAGIDVVLLEAHRVGFGASGRNGGQVSGGQRVDQPTLERRHGPEAARALWHMGQDAITLVRDLLWRHRIEADWRPGILHAANSRRAVAHAHAEAARLARDYSYDALETLDAEATRAICPSPAYHGGVLDHGSGHLHPLRLALGLAQAADAAGARLCEGSHVLRLVQGDAGRPARLHLATGAEVVADHVILAANGYLEGLEPTVAARVMPINNYIVATEPLGARAESVLRRPVAVADNRFVVNYFRLSPDGRLLFGGGETYGYRFPRDIAAKVRGPMSAVFPHLSDVPITHAWGGTLAITRSRLPVFARPAPGVLSASGYSGHGVALAVLAGRAMAEAVRGEGAAFDTLARLPAARFPGGPALREPLLALAMTWFALRDRLGI
jgi:gamma-glutamylputrescine oxidase